MTEHVSEQSSGEEFLEIADILLIVGGIGALVIGYNLVAIALILLSIRFAVGR